MQSCAHIQPVTIRLKILVRSGGSQIARQKSSLITRCFTGLCTYFVSIQKFECKVGFFFGMQVFCMLVRGRTQPACILPSVGNLSTCLPCNLHRIDHRYYFYYAIIAIIKKKYTLVPSKLFSSKKYIAVGGLRVTPNLSCMLRILLGIVQCSSSQSG